MGFSQYKTIIIIIAVIVLCSFISYYFKKNETDTNLSNLNYIKEVDDITKMNKTNVEGVFNVLTVKDIIDIIKLAKINNKKVIARGETHSMGGHTIAKDGYIIDTKFMNHILETDLKKKTVSVEPGITWHRLIYHLNMYGMTPKILQSYASFSVGGSTSVNVHGITSDNSLSDSIIELEIVNYDGDILLCNRDINKELFSLVMGGYGLFGIITKIKLSIEENTQLIMKTQNLNIYNFPKIYKTFLDNSIYKIKIARINITNMEDIYLYTFRIKEKEMNKIISKLDENPKEMSKLSQLLYKWVLPNKEIQKIRFDLEKAIGKPLDINTDKNTNIITRNSFLYESATPLSNLYSPLININKTHILQEYFIPATDDNFIEWMKYLKKIFINKNDYMSGINLLNITIRYVLKDNNTFLKYANTDMYAFVFYYRMNRDKSSDNKLKYIHNLLVNKTLEFGGTFYLPYRHHYSNEQLIVAYPNISQFMSFKKRYDPDERFVNLWYMEYRDVFNKDETKMVLNLEKHLKFQVAPIDNQEINNNSFQLVLSDKINRQKLNSFLVNVFNMVDPNELYNYIYTTYKLNKTINDNTMFLKIKEYIQENYNGINLTYKSYTLLNKQTEIINSAVKELLLKIGINYPLNNYINIGDSGRYIGALKESLNITGNIYSMNNQYNYLEGINTNFKSSFIKYDFEKMDEFKITEHVDLVTCFIGLHHFKEDKLIIFLKNIYNILNSNGVFIIRDHNTSDSLIPLLNCAHNIFNGVTGETLQTEKNELRNFKSIEYWRNLVQSFGFTEMKIYTSQLNDPTENLFICFMKIDDNSKKISLNLKSKAYQDENYQRNITQTYLTTPEWYSVDLIKDYGTYLEKTPWYEYSYFKKIIEYWNVFIKSTSTAINKTSVTKTLSSWSYIVMNFVIGVLLTIVFLQLGILSVIPYTFYHLPGNEEISNIQMIIYDQNNIIKDLDKRIKIKNNEGNYYIIEIPRYKKFKQLVINMISNGIEIVEIAGQNEIQVKIGLNDKNKVEALDSVDILYDYEMYEDSYVLINIKVDKLFDLLNNDIEIKHIYDY